VNPEAGPAARPHYTVLGAGIVGACCALALRQEGFPVTLIDRDAPGMGSSYGNAGLIQTGMPIPVATPGMMHALPGYLTDPESPLAIRWRHLPALAPFLLRLAAASRPQRVETIVKAIHAIAAPAGEAHRAMARDAHATNLFGSRGILFVYPNEGACKADAPVMELFERNGASVERLHEDAIRQMEPALDRSYRWAYHLPDNFYTVNPSALTGRYAAQFEALGGELVRDDVHDLEMGPDGPQALLCASGRRSIQHLVIALGAHANPFLKRLGVRLPLESGRGYHLMLPTPGTEICGPVVDGEVHFAATPMAEGIRLAGTIEFASVDAAPDWRRADMLYRLAKRMLPALDDTDAARWMGHRPLLPDSLPAIGHAPGHHGVLLALGHGQFGLTLGAITGQIIAALAAGREPPVDLSPYRPDRF
jgi:D-amino-acid dehydrogenase